jgi:hypothetical protein
MRFFFDIRDDFFAASDEDGTEFPDVEGAKKEAIAMGTSIARDVFTSKGSKVVVTVRTADKPVFQVRVILEREDMT